MKNDFAFIDPAGFRYELPKDRIALYPLAERDLSKLLVMESDAIISSEFRNLSAHLPSGAMLLFNDTKVIRARMVFHKVTGAAIEVFFLNPLEPSTDHEIAFSQGSPAVWECVIGNARKWKEGELLLHFMCNGASVTLCAELLSKGRDSARVRLSWDPSDIPLADIFEAVGHIPLPPYIDRADEPLDAERYQTVYALHDGSVAAPTAGLHFTTSVLSDLASRGIRQEKITLHVGAGTFRPVSADSVADHVMHREEIVIHRQLLEALVHHPGVVIPVGTTSVRSIESVYWYGLRAILKQEPLAAHFSVAQWEPYGYSVSELLPYRELFSWLLRAMDEQGFTTLRGDTSLMIVPGYPFAVTAGLVTNFHQPGSTLLMLVAALVGERWKEAYRFALDNDFRFLSYGDACLFL